MPSVICPNCATPAILPDPWPHPGYTCVGCRATVAIATPAPAAPEDPLDFDSDSAPARRPIEYRDRTRMSDAAATGFGTGFGRALGGYAAGCLVFGVGFLVIAAVIAVLMSRQH